MIRGRILAKIKRQLIGAPRVDEKTMTHREWARMTVTVSASILLAYGVIRAPEDRWNWNWGREPKAEAPSTARRKVRVFAQDAELVSSAEGLAEVTLSGKGFDSVARELDSVAENPDVVLLVTEQDGDTIRFEIQAFNPSGPGGGKLIENAPMRHLASLPVHDLQRKLKKAGHKAVISYAVGDPVLNEAFFRLLQRSLPDLKQERRFQAGLVQLPRAVDPAARAQALKLILEEAARSR